jgi:CHASE2 domain-containing sensor protein
MDNPTTIPGGAPVPRGFVAAATAAVAVGLAVALWAVGALSPIERAAYDVELRLRGTRPADRRVVVVAVDDRTVAAVGTLPPIARGYYASAMDVVHAAGARLIAVDVQFVGASRAPADDDALVAAAARDQPVVLAASDLNTGDTLAGRPLPSGAVLASVGADPDPGGVLRSMMYRPYERLALPVRAAQLLTGHLPPLGDFPDNHALIDFPGPAGTVTTVSLIDVVSGQVPADRFAGRIVLIGVTAPSQRDIALTSVSRTPLSGVEIEADALATVLAGIPLRSVSWPVELLLVVLLTVLPLVSSMRLPATGTLMVATTALGGFLFLAQLAFDQGHVVDVAHPAAGWVIGVTGAVGVDALLQRRQATALQAALDGALRPTRAAFFISYRRLQTSFAANVLRAELVHRFDSGAVFLDQSHLRAGQEWPEEIRQALVGSSVVLLLIGPGWVDVRDGLTDQRRLDDPDDWVRREVELALACPDVMLVPVLVDGGTVPAEEDLPPGLAGLTRRLAFTLTGVRLSDEVDELLDAIRTRRRDAPPSGLREEPEP